MKMSPELLEKTTPVPLMCNCCDTPMRMQKHDKHVIHAAFYCTNWDCDQDIGFRSNGEAYCTILARLYPSDMKEGSKIFREYVQYRLEEFKFYTKARVLCGLLTEEEARTRIAASEITVEKKLQELDAKRCGFWKRLGALFIPRIES